MNREIKFRGKRVDNGEWVFGSLVQDNHPEIKKSFIHYNDLNDLFERFSVEITPETVGQFTGLTDKNGREIYEGDIVKTTYQYHDTLKEDIAAVEYDKLNPCFVMVYKFQGNGHTCHEYDFVCVGLRKNEVIGNLHDNPELLK